MSAFLSIDLPALLAALLALVACGSLGTWLVLRKQAMTGDAIAHAVLPGLVGGFLLTGTRSTTAMLVGAALAGVASVLLAALVRTRARADAGTALGIVLTAFFALGIVLLETQGARQVDLDPECVLFGSLESLFAVDRGDGWLASLPRPVWTLATAAACSVALSLAFSKELAAAPFDPPFAEHPRAAPRWLEPLVLAATSASIVLAFEAVGSILVVAFVACPALIAAPHARSVAGQMTLGIAVSALLAAAAYFAAAHADRLFGAPTSLNSAGMIALLLALAVPCSHAARAALSRRQG
ncbi:MAG: metal ABC transporter permease [Phycisphaerales bacterium]